MKRRIFSGLLFASMLFTFTACNNNANPNNTDKPNTDNPSTDVPDSKPDSGDKVEKKSLAVKVLYPDGNPASEVKVVWHNATSKTAAVETNLVGTAKTTIDDENDNFSYSVKLSNLPEGYSYNPYTFTQTKDNMTANITLIESGEVYSGTGSSETPYQIGEGYYTVSENQDKVYYSFVPTEKGTYTIESYAPFDCDPTIKFAGYSKTNAVVNDNEKINKINGLSYSDNDSSNGSNFKFKFDVKTIDVLNSKAYTFELSSKEKECYCFNVVKSDLEVEDESPNMDLYNLSFKKVSDDSEYKINRDGYLKVVYFYDTTVARSKIIFDKLAPMMDETGNDFEIIAVCRGSKYNADSVSEYFTKNSVSSSFVSCYDEFNEKQYETLGGAGKYPCVVLLGKDNEIITKYEGDIMPTALANKIYEAVFNNYNDMTKVGAEKGKMAICAPVKAYDGSKINISDYRGKIVVINMWATWCNPCVSELPNFDEVNRRRSDVEIIAIHGPNGFVQADYDAFMAKSNWSIKFVKDYSTSIIWKYLGTPSAIPTTIIVDKNGVISNVHTGGMSGDALEKLIDAAK